MEDQATAVTPSKSNRSDALSLAHGLSAARAGATLLVLVAHAGIPYMYTPLRSAMWLVHDGANDIAIDILLCFVNALAMPLFFLMAGMSAGTATASGSLRDFLGRRFRRLGTPFLVGCLTIVPVCYLLWGLGLLYSERVPMAQLFRMSFRPEIKASAIGPFHLWFLEYLLVLSAIWCVIVCSYRWWTKDQQQSSAFLQSLLRWGATPWIWIAVTACICWIDKDSAYRLENSFLPDLQRVVHYLVFFVAGVAIIRQPQPGATLQKRCGWYVAAAALLFPLLLPVMMEHISTPVQGPKHIYLAVGQSLFVWLALFGGLGLCVRYLGKRNDTIRYLSESSFWTYLIHLPLVALSQLILWNYPWSVWIKLAAASTVGLVLSLLSYEICVRYSWLGELLNGGRKRLKNVSAWRKEIGWVSVAAGMFVWLGAFLWTHRDGIWGPHLEVVVPGEVYRSFRMNESELKSALAEHHFRTIVNLAGGTKADKWQREQKAIAQAFGAEVVNVAFSEDEVPSSRQIIQFAEVLKTAPRPVLMQGHRTPTLGGLGGAIAILLQDDGTAAEAKEQFSWRHFQVEGPEHCIVAAPIRNYEAWIAQQDKPHSPRTFLYWTARLHRSPKQLRQEESEATELQARLGAPRYNVRLR